MIHRIVIPAWRPATINRLMFGRVKDRIKRRQYDDAIVAVYAKRQDIPKALGKRKVSLEITLKGRERAADEGAYAKSLYDALVNCGMLLGDTVGLVATGTTTYFRGPEGQTVVILEDVE